MRCRINFTALLILLAGCAFARGESPAVLLEEGIHKEETAGDLDGAIAVYNQIVNEEKTARPFVAQAMYRMANCYQKKGQSRKALQTLQSLIATCPDQEQWAAKARERMAANRSAMNPEEIAGIVKEAVERISTMAESDTNLPKTLATVAGLNDKVVVKELARYLSSEKQTVRRAAMYILWQGDLSDIEPAAPALIDQMKNSKDE